MRLAALWRNLIHRDRVDGDLDEEVQATLDLLADEKRRAGLSEVDARRAAAIELGGVESAKTQVREARAGASFDALLQDVRYAVRLLRRHPGFAVAVVLTLAFGVGATSAVFTLADPMLFRPLPYPDADRLYVVRVTAPGVIGGRAQMPDALRLEEDVPPALAGVGHFEGPLQAQLSRGSTILGYRVTAGFLPMLGVQPVLGRAFTAAEHRPGDAGAAVALITFELWQSRYGGSAEVLEASIDAAYHDVRRYQIVGVLPRGFVLPDHLNAAPAFFTPMAIDPTIVGRNSIAVPYVRLAQGATVDQAAAQVNATLAAVEREHAEYPQGRRAQLVPLRDALFGRMRTPLLMLLAATGCVLLLASANLAHLFAARLGNRQRELAVRVAIGAGRWRVARLIGVEALVLALAGGAASLVVGHWTFALIMSLTPDLAHVYRLMPAGLDWRVVAFSVALVGLTTLLFAAAPMALASRASLGADLARPGSRQRARRIHPDTLLIAAQSGVAMLLLVASALIVGSFMRLAFQPLGYEPERVQLVTLQWPDAAPADLVQILRLPGDLYARLRQHAPNGVALAGSLPGLTISGAVRRADGAETGPRIASHPGSSTIFTVFGIRLLGGRLFTEQEAMADAPVAVLDERAAATLWPGGEAIGQLVRSNEGTVRTVVGIVERIREQLVDDPPSTGTAFVPISADDRAVLVIRADSRGPSLAALETAVAAAAPEARLRVAPFRPFERTLGQPRFLAAVLGALGVLTVILTIVGIFGVVHHQVVRRTKEMGIRTAFGATRVRLRGMVLRQTGTAATAGIVLGAGTAFWWTSGLRALLYELEPNDPSTLLLCGLFVLLLVVCAALRPAVGASRVEPVEALRVE